MATANDVAAYVLQKQGEMSAMKMQKLVYYSQAWSLAWDDRPLFDDPIQAWARGPVVVSLYEQHRGVFLVNQWSAGNPDALTASEKETIDVVLQGYGNKSPQDLSNATHREAPWLDARRGLGINERGRNVIPLEAMQEYYASLLV